MTVRIFLSHASADRALAERVCTALETWGHQCWIAPRDVRAGHEYSAEIIDGLERCDVVLLLLTASANASKMVAREVEIADKRNKVVHVLPLERVPLAPRLELFISANQWFQASGSLDDDLRVVAAALGPRGGQATEIVQLPTETQAKPGAPQQAKAASPEPRARQTAWRLAAVSIGLLGALSLVVALTRTAPARTASKPNASEPAEAASDVDAGLSHFTACDGGCVENRIATGNSVSCAELSDGLRCWGDDLSGQAGSEGTSGGAGGQAGRQVERQLDELQEEELNAIISKNKPSLVRCFRAVATPGMTATVPVEFSISETGQVTRAWVDNPQFDGSGLEECLLGELRQWPFTPRHGPVSVKLTFHIGRKASLNSDTPTDRSGTDNATDQGKQTRRDERTGNTSENRCLAGMRFVPAGTFLMGTPRDDLMMAFDEKTLSPVMQEAYCIDTFEYPNQRGQIPLVSTDFANATRLCELQGKRLCTEAEWEKACKGPGGARWPFGNTFDSNVCNTEDEAGDVRSLATVGRFAKCRSGYGAADMAGNAAEWTSDRIIKGGSYGSGDYAVRCSARKNGISFYKSSEVGLRCCADAVLATEKQ